MFQPRIIVLTLMVLAAAFSRLIPHPPNFTPILSLALFGGAYYGSRKLAYLVPLGAMVISDLGLGILYGYEFLTPMRGVVYGSIMLITTAGFFLRDNVKLGRVAFASVASSVLFHVITNFAVWAGDLMYPPTLAGLVACYVAAIPFYPNTLMSALVYSALLFGGFELAKRRFPVLAGAKAQ